VVGAVTILPLYHGKNMKSANDYSKMQKAS